MNKPSISNSGLSARLAMYSASAGALVLLGLPANSQVAYSGVQNLETEFPNDTLSIDLNADGTDDFGFIFYHSTSEEVSSGGLVYNWYGRYAVIINQRTDSYKNSWLTGFSTITFPSYYGTSAVSYRLPVIRPVEEGELIGSSASGWEGISHPSFLGALAVRQSNQTVYGTSSFSNSLSAGKFRSDTSYIGLRFHIGSELHYGWLRVHLTDTIAPVTLIDWAYESTADKAIQAGDGLIADLPPSLLFSLTGGGMSANSTITLTATESITGLEESDLIITNGTLSNFAEVVAGEVYTFEVSAVSEGEVVLNIASDAFTDASANGNLPLTFTWQYDLTPPQAQIINLYGERLNSPGVLIMVQFSEKVTELNISDWVTNNCEVTGMDQSLDGTIYYIDAYTLAEGEGTLSLPEGVVTDMSGNPNVAASTSWVYDFTPPEAVFTGIQEETSDDTQLVTITFSEEILNFQLYDLQLINCEATSLTTITPGREYQFQVRALDLGLVSVELPSFTIYDLAGNPNYSSFTSDWYFIETAVHSSDLGSNNKVYPNPTADHITISVNEPVSITIYDMAGEVHMLTDYFPGEELDLSGIDAGAYILQIESKSGKITRKLIKH